MCHDLSPNCHTVEPNADWQAIWLLLTHTCTHACRLLHRKCKRKEAGPSAIQKLFTLSKALHIAGLNFKNSNDAAESDSTHSYLTYITLNAAPLLTVQVRYISNLEQKWEVRYRGLLSSLSFNPHPPRFFFKKFQTWFQKHLWKHISSSVLFF